MFTPTMQLSVHVKEVESMIKARFFGVVGWSRWIHFEMCQWWMFFV